VGRPLFNISLLTDVMRRWGLPTRLITNSIGGSADVEVGFRWGRFVRKSPVLLRQGVAQLRAVTLAEKRATTFLELAATVPVSGDSFAAANDTFRLIFTGFVLEMFNLTAALSAPLLILRGTGTLEEHSTRQQTAGTQMLTALDTLRAYVVAQPHIQPALLEGELPANEGFRELWHTFLEQHGHRGVYESDIARPRYAEVPESLLQSLAYPSRGRAPDRPRTWKGWLTLPVWWQCGRVLRAREQFRYDTMRAYQRVRGRLLTLAQQAVANGQLPDTASLWLLTLEEAAQLDQGHIFDLAFLAQRRHEVEAFESYTLPDLIHRFDNLEQYRSNPERTIADGPVVGVSLTTGRVRGRAWVLHKPDHQLPGGFTPENTILIARSVDAGWIPTFRQVAGVVVDIGGDLSHGSIILREIGLPAITNCGRATQTFQTGDEVELDAGRGQAMQVTPEKAR
jgi:pyruvate,water dikinase